MHSNRQARLTGLCFSLVMGAAAHAQAATAGHCGAQEQVVFSCQVGAKTVSLCSVGHDAQIASLTYRYGRRGKVENEFIANADNGRRFFATASPLKPGASINQLWFDNGDTRFLVTECVGGRCPYQAGLAVLRGDELLMRQRCARSEPDTAAFSRQIITFGSGSVDSRSQTPLIQIDDADNGLAKIYATKR